MSEIDRNTFIQVLERRIFFNLLFNPIISIPKKIQQNILCRNVRGCKLFKNHDVKIYTLERMRIRRDSNEEDIEEFLHEQTQIIERVPTSGHNDILGQYDTQP